MDAVKGKYIKFKDPEVERICIANYSSDGIGVTKDDAAAVTMIARLIFTNNETITTFDELRFFVNLTTIDGSSVGNGAFGMCSNLSSIVLPPSITTIGNSSFYGCGLACEIDLPNLQSIGYFAFKSTKITKVKSLGSITSLPDGTASWSVFNGCTSLTEVTLPSTLTNIGDKSFRGCSALKTVTCNATNPPTLGTDAFDGVTLEHIFVPSSAVNDYKAAPGWSDYASIIEAIQSN